MIIRLFCGIVQRKRFFQSAYKQSYRTAESVGEKIFRFFFAYVCAVFGKIFYVFFARIFVYLAKEIILYDVVFCDCTKNPKDCF